MTFSLDTNVLIDVLRRRDPVNRHAFARAVLNGEAMVASMLVHHELLMGVALHPSPDTERRNVRTLMSQIKIEAFDARDMAVAALVRADLKRRGLPIGPYDALIASQALARGWTIVTRNLGEFGRVPNLKIANWAIIRETWSRL